MLPATCDEAVQEALRTRIAALPVKVTLTSTV
jgi:hypothetical protein